MEFDMLMNYSPEAQLELMNTMLQLEQLAGLDGHQSPTMAPVSPPISPIQTHAAGHSFSPPPPPHMSTTTTTGYPEQYTPPAAAVYATGGLLQDCCYVLSPTGGGAAAAALQQSSASSPPTSSSSSAEAMREAIFHIAALQPVEIEIDPAAVRPPKRRNVRISKDPQSVAARLRRERISERIRTLQRLVPGGTKMDTASMLDEAIHYVKFLKSQVQALERAAAAAAATTTHRAPAALYPAFHHAPAWQQYAPLPHGGDM